MKSKKIRFLKISYICIKLARKLRRVYHRVTPSYYLVYAHPFNTMCIEDEQEETGV